MTANQPARIFSVFILFLEIGIVFGQWSKTSHSSQPAYSITISTVAANQLKADNAAINHPAKVNRSITKNLALLPAPPNIIYQTPQTYQTNIAITPLAPANSGGAVPATLYGQVSTYAGYSVGFQNGSALLASFNDVVAVGVDNAGN